MNSKSNLYFGLRKTALFTVYYMTTVEGSLQIAPQHRLSRGIIYFPDVVPGDRVVCVKVGKDSRPNHRLWRPMCFTNYTATFINMRFLTRRVGLSNSDSNTTSVDESTHLNSCYLFSDAKRNVFDSRYIASGIEPTTFGMAAG